MMTPEPAGLAPSAALRRLLDHARSMAQDPQQPDPDRRLWALIATDIEAFLGEKQGADDAYLDIFSDEGVL